MKMWIYVGTYEGSVIILQTDLTKIKSLHHLNISQNSIKTICAFNNQYLVAGGYDQQLKIIDLENYQQKIQVKQNHGQISIISKINDKLFVTGVDDGTIKLWDSVNWCMIKQSRYHKKSISNILIAKEGKLMITAAGNKIIMWNANNLKKAHQYKLSKNIIIQKLKITDDTKLIFYSSAEGQIWKINTQNNEQKLIIKIPKERKIQDLIIYQEFIIIGNDIGEIMAWKYLQQQQEVDILQKYDHRVWFKAHNSRIKSLTIVMDAYLLLGTAAGDLSIWDFPQFLTTVEKISKNYFLEGLRPLCFIIVKGRILCIDSVIKDNKQQQQNQQQRIIVKLVENKKIGIRNRQQLQERKSKIKLVKKKLKIGQNKLQFAITGDEKTKQSIQKNRIKTKKIKK